jgi:hypothetical protein
MTASGCPDGVLQAAIAAPLALSSLRASDTGEGGLSCVTRSPSTGHGMLWVAD